MKPYRVARALSACLGALCAAAAMARPAWAVPVTLDRLSYDDSSRRLSFATTGAVQVHLRQIGSQVVIEIPDAHLRRDVVLPGRDSREIRRVHASEIVGVPPLVRIDVALAPGIEPQLTVQQSGGTVFVWFGDRPQPDGERDSEVFPSVPAGPLPPLGDLRPQPSHRTPVPWVWPSPDPTPPPQPALPPPVAALPSAPAPGFGATPPSLPPSPSPESGAGSGTKSFVLVRVEQSDAIEAVSGQNEVGYPTGPAEIEWRQWIGPYFGLGLDARYFDWTERGTSSIARQQALANVQIGARMPWPYAEPEVFVGAGARYEAFAGKGSAPVEAPTVGGGIRIQPLDALGLRLWGRAYPIGIGDGLWSAGAEFLIDAGPGLASIGYTWDQISVAQTSQSPGGYATYGTVTAGFGLQY